MFCDSCTAGPRQFYPLRNNNMGYYITSADDFSHTLIGEVRKNITLNSRITLGQYTRVLFMNIPKSKDGALLAIAPGNKIITAFRNNGVWEEKSSHFIATKSDLDSFAEKKLDLTISEFNSYVKSKTNRISFFAFSNAVDSPFSFKTGFCIAFNRSYLMNTGQFCLIGVSIDGTKIETKLIQIS